MSKVVVLGGTGYTGSAVVGEAAGRGHDVTSVSRTAPVSRVDGVSYSTGNVTDESFLAAATLDADVVVSTLSARGELDGAIVEVYRSIANLAAERSARVLVVGGFSSLRPAEGEPNAVDGGQVPEAFRGEATQMNTVLTDLKASAPETLDWVFLSPAQQFGAFAPGEPLGRYRVGGDVALFDVDGQSAISGADFAHAVVDEIDRPRHHRAHIGIAY